MVPTPIALGLTLCERVMVEEGTRQVSLIGTFNGLRRTAFPFVPPPFYVFATLTGSAGNAEIELTVRAVSTDDEVYSFRGSVRSRTASRRSACGCA